MHAAPNIDPSSGTNNLIAAINFFVVLPSIVITLNPRDWRGRRPNSEAPDNGAPLFACGSKTNDSLSARALGCRVGADLMERLAS
jgi:hypothetical protein